MGVVHAKEKSPNVNDISSADPPPKPRPQIKLSQASVRVDRIHINGIARTKDDVVEASIDELFKAKNFEEVLIKADNVKTKLDSLGCFSNIGIFVDVSKGANASANGLEVTFNVEELRRVIGGVNTTVGNNTGSLVIGMKAPNFAGRGEKLQCEYSKGFHKFSNFSLTLSKPFPYKKYEPVVSASIIQQIGEYAKSGYRQLDKGLLLDLGFRTTQKAYHNLQWEGIFRDTSPLSKTTAFAVRESSGPAMKSAIRHILTIDGRDNKVFPTVGKFLQFTSELSGLGGSMSFLKNDLCFQSNVELMDGVTLQGSVQTGLLNDFHGTNLTEHFYMGGPLSVRGFDLRGVGPQSDGSSLGSNLQYFDSTIQGSKFYWATGAHLFTPLPFRPGKGGFGDNFKTHFFVNAGNITPINNLQNLEASINSIMKDIRVSAGLGIAMNVANMARFELNYCFPLKYISTDVIAPGLQFGLGVNFL